MKKRLRQNYIYYKKDCQVRNKIQFCVQTWMNGSVSKHLASDINFFFLNLNLDI